MLLAACSRNQDPTVPLGTTSSTASATSLPSTTTPAPTSTTPAAPAQPAASTPATATCPAVPVRRGPDQQRPSYVVDVRVDLDRNIVEGRETVRFTPDLVTDHLVFRLWPNGPRLAESGARLDVGGVYLGGTAPVPTQRPNPTTLVVPLNRPLRAGETIEATVPFTLTLPGPTSDRISRRGDTVRLGTFVPLLAWEPGVGWATEPPTALFAEASTAPVADWSMSISAPAGLTVFASGDQRNGRWIASAMRDVAAAVGRFRVVAGTARAPQPVAVTVAVEGGMSDDPASYLPTVTGALADFSSRFGPYPFDRYTLVLTPDLHGGIEYPSFVHQGPKTGGRTTPHELGHQWFYALVGNDQGRDPWLDEGLATWAEVRYLSSVASLRAKVIPSDARGHAGESMAFWDAGHGSSYFRGVYVQGAQAIGALGAPEQVDCALRQVVARNAYRIATNREVIDALRVVFPDAEAVLRAYGIASRS